MSTKPITISAYIGSNNKTKQLEIDKIVKIANKNHDEFTLDYPKLGYWKGESEDTAVLLLSDDKQKILATLEELKEVLEQDAIAYQIENDLQII